MNNSTAKPQASMGYQALIRHDREFRFLWFGQVVSEGGDWFNLIASSSLVALYTGSGLAVGILFVIRTLAPFLASPLGGVLADRFDRKKIIVLTSILRAVVLFGFLLVQQKEDLWLLYALTTLQLFLSGLFFPARTAIIPDLVSKENIGTATAIMGMTFSSMLAIGSAMGGFVAGFIGVEVAFIINAVAYIVSAFFLQQVRYKQPAIEFVDGGKQRLFKDFIEGLYFIRDRKYLWPILPHKAMVGMLLGATFEILLVSIAEKQIVNSLAPSVSLGIMFFVTGVGLTGAILLVRLWVLDDIGRVCWAMFVGYLIGALGLGFVSLLNSYGVILFGNFLRGAGNGIIYLFSIQLVLMITPAKVRGRFVSLEFAAGMLGTSSTSLLIGWLLDNGGSVGGIARTMAYLTLLPGILWAVWLLIVKPLPFLNRLIYLDGDPENELSKI